MQEFLQTTIGTVPFPKNLHWKNFLQPINFLVTNKEQIDNVLEQMLIEHPFTPDDWSYLAEFSNMIKLIFQASNILESEPNVCLAFVLPTIFSLLTKIKDFKSEKCRFFQCGLIYGIQSRFSAILNFEHIQNKSFLLATISHPKFKMMWAPVEQYNYLVDIFINECQHIFTKAPLDSASNDCFFEFTSPPSWSFVQEEINDYLQNRNYTISCLHGFPTVKKMFLKCNTALPSTGILAEIFEKTEQKVGFVEMKELQKMIFINENRKLLNQNVI